MVIRGDIGLTRRLGAAEQHTGRLMSVWILSLETEHRQNQWVTIKVRETQRDHLRSVPRSSCLRLPAGRFRSRRHLRFRVERCNGWGQAQARSVRSSGSILRCGQFGWDRPRRDDWSASTRSDQRLAIHCCVDACRADDVLLVSKHQSAEQPRAGIRRRRTALFAVSGAGKALAFDAGPVAATLLGMLTAIGGGMVRDILVMEIPTVLRTELYALAALIGAAVVVLGRMLYLPLYVAAIAVAVLCFGLRFMAMRRGWQLPTAHPPE